MNRSIALMTCVVMVAAAGGCSYHRAYISYDRNQDDVRIAASAWDGQRLGPVTASEGGAIWEKCTDVAEGSVWVLMDEARRMGGNALGDIRWVPQTPSRSTEIPTCKKKWGWFLIWPVLVTPAFMSASVEAVAYDVPDLDRLPEGVVAIPESDADRVALARQIVHESLTSRP